MSEDRLDLGGVLRGFIDAQRVGALAGEVAGALGVAEAGPATLAWHLLRSPAVQTVVWRP